jgi:hypothetical protein
MVKKFKEVPGFKSPETDYYLSSLIESINDGKEMLKVRKGTTVFPRGQCETPSISFNPAE